MSDRQTTTFRQITDQTEIEHLFAHSETEPVLVFKHDPWCSISLMAQRRLAKLDREVPTIDVAGNRALSLGFADQIGVRHESPQVLVLRDGAAVWSASHGAITATAVEEALRAADPAAD